MTWGFINGSANGDFAPTGLNLMKETSDKTPDTMVGGHDGGILYEVDFGQKREIDYLLIRS